MEKITFQTQKGVFKNVSQAQSQNAYCSTFVRNNWMSNDLNNGQTDKRLSFLRIYLTKHLLKEARTKDERTPQTSYVWTWKSDIRPKQKRRDFDCLANFDFFGESKSVITRSHGPDVRSLLFRCKV